MGNLRNYLFLRIQMHSECINSVWKCIKQIKSRMRRAEKEALISVVALFGGKGAVVYSTTLYGMSWLSEFSCARE